MATKYIAALILIAAAGSSFAAEDKTQATRTADTDVTVRTVDYPTAAFMAATGRTRAEVKAEAVEAAKHHRSTLDEQFDLLK